MSPGLMNRNNRRKEKLTMDKMESLRAGVAEMRSVAQRLMEWADDLEASFQGQEAPKEDAGNGKPALAERKKKAAADKAAPEICGEPESDGRVLSHCPGYVRG